MKILKMPNMVQEVIETTMDKRPPWARWRSPKMSDVITVKLPGKLRFTNGQLELGGNETMELGVKIPSLRTDRGYTLFGVIPTCIHENGYVVDFCIDYMERS